MASKQSRVSYILVLLVFLIISTKVAAQEAGVITKKQALKYMTKDRAPLMEYKCASDQKIDCKVICSSGGNDYIKAENVAKAFHFERRSGINGGIIGYFLIIDVAPGSNKDSWATLQVESSCTFLGMSPTL